MITYAKLLNKQTGLVTPLFNESQIYKYKSQGYRKLDIERSDIDFLWYLAEKCPHKNTEQQLKEAKVSKLQENDTVANTVIQKTFTIEVTKDNIPCEFIYNEKTERNLNSSALGFITNQYESKDWTDEQGITVQLTAEDVAKVLLTFNEFVNAIWAKWGTYKQQIDNATSLEEVEAIVLNYGVE